MNIQKIVSAKIKIIFVALCVCFTPILANATVSHNYLSLPQPANSSSSINIFICQVLENNPAIQAAMGL